MTLATLLVSGEEGAKHTLRMRLFHVAVENVQVQPGKNECHFYDEFHMCIILQISALLRYMLLNIGHYIYIYHKPGGIFHHALFPVTPELDTCAPHACAYPLLLCIHTLSLSRFL